MRRRTPKPLEWVGSSKTDLREFPEAVRDHMGFALFQAQVGLKSTAAKPLRGFGSGVLEIVSRFDGDTYRAVYAVRFEKAIYVLHAFQKKAKAGIATPRHELDLMARRLKAAEIHYHTHYAKERDHGHDC